MDVASFLSYPTIAFNTSALSNTVLVTGPIWSSEDANAISPYLETLPYVGFIPTTPQNDAGCRIDPPVSDPSVYTASFAATEAADPPDEPPGTLFVSNGFLQILNAEFSVVDPIANSSIFNFPRIIAPDFSNFSTTCALYGGI